MTDQITTHYHNLEEIKLEFLKYAPAYAQSEAREAIEKISFLQSQNVIRNGLYYVVLVDLVGSTKFAATHGNQEAASRVETSSPRRLTHSIKYACPISASS